MMIEFKFRATPTIVTPLIDINVQTAVAYIQGSAMGSEQRLEDALGFIKSNPEIPSPRLPTDDRANSPEFNLYLYLQAVRSGSAQLILKIVTELNSRYNLQVEYSDEDGNTEIVEAIVVNCEGVVPVRADA